MIPSLALVLSIAWAQPADDPSAELVTEETAVEQPADDAPEPTPEDPLSRYRVPFKVLANRTIGNASVPVAFDWRRTKIHFGGTGSFLFELNTFNTARVGGMVRLPNRASIVEIGLSYARVWNSESSRQLAFTPYRQPGRPSRLEIEAAVALPLAEGVVTAMPRFFPATQLVFNATLGVRYVVYPTGFQRLTPGQVAQTIVSPELLPEEIANLEDARLAAMTIDPARYGLMAGFTNDIYFERGIFVSPRVQFAVPLLALVSNSGLPFWVDVNLAVGVAL